MNGATDNELIARLRSGEHNLVERKSEGVTPRELREALCAFANSLGERETAVLYIGVRNGTGEVVGVESPQAVQTRVAKAAEDCAPPISYQTRELEIGGKRLIAVVVGHSTEVPHFTGAAYIREGDRTKRTTAEQHERLIASRNSTVRRLLEWKAKHHRIMVSAFYKQLGFPELDPRQRWGPHACRIEAVDAHTVTFHVLGSGLVAGEPISDVYSPRTRASRRSRYGHGWDSRPGSFGAHLVR